SSPSQYVALDFSAEVQWTGDMTTRDVELVHAVTRAFTREPRLDPAGITVTADSGEVVLRGRVATHAERLAAVTVAAAVDGVAHVTNSLTVDEVETEASRATDAALLEAVGRAVLASTVAVSGLELEVRHHV